MKKWSICFLVMLVLSLMIPFCEKESHFEAETVPILGNSTSVQVAETVPILGGSYQNMV